MLRFAGQPKVLLKSDRSVLLRLALLQSSSSAAYLVFRFAKYPLSHGSALWKQLRLSVFLYVCKPHHRYAELKAQAVDLDPVELHDARQAIRPEKELNAVEQLQRAYGDKYRPLAMLDSKRKASGLLHEYADEQAVQKLKRAQQQKIQSEHTPPQSKKKRIDFER